MDMTRATFLIATALVVALAVAAAGIGAYIAVRQNAPASNVTLEQPAPETRVAAALHGIDPRAAVGEARSEPGIAVASTEQVLEPAADGAEPPDLEVPPSPRSAAPAPRQEPEPRRAARPATAAARAPDPPRREPSGTSPRVTERIERPTARPAPERAQPDPEPDAGLAREPAEPPRRPQATGRRAVPEVEGWRPADPAPSNGGSPPVRRDAVRDLPPVAPADLDPPIRGAGAEPPLPGNEALLIPADSVIGLQIDTFVTTEHAEVEDDVQARVTRDVMVARRVAIPAGSLVNGSVVMVERGGKLKGTARLGVRFHTVVLDDRTEVPITTETVYREGRSRGRDNAARIGGGAVAGAILGAIFGGGRGAAIGGAAGAAGGTAAAAAGDAEPATLPAGTTLTVRLARPSSVTVQR